MRQLKYKKRGHVFDKIDDRLYCNIRFALSQDLISRIYDKLRHRNRRNYDWLYWEIRRS